MNNNVTKDPDVRIARHIESEEEGDVVAVAVDFAVDVAVVEAVATSVELFRLRRPSLFSPSL